MAPVEARSLANLIALASNPPQYPRNPTAELLDPLVLYIARVPGSKDIFLTTMKPRQKVVTAEDVSSCLYFLHFNQASETEIIRDGHATGPGQKSNSSRPELKDNVVLRKPLAERPLSVTETGIHRSAASDSQHLPVCVGRKPIERKPLLSVNESSRDGQPPSPPKQSTVQGANSLSAHSSENTRPQILYSQCQHLRPHSAFDTSNVLGTVPHPGLGSISTPLSLPKLQTSELGGEHCLHQQPNKSSFFGGHGRTMAANAAITLIRRDPGSGAQWNVGIISNEKGNMETAEELATNLQRAPHLDLGSEIELEIRTPGYSKFITPQTMRTNNPPSHISHNEELLQSQDSLAPYSRHLQIATPLFARVFKRSLFTDDTKPWNQNRQPSELRSSEGLAGSRDFSQGRNTRRNNTQDTSTDYPMAGNNQSSSGGPGGRHQTFVPKAGAHIFLSPWGGRCEFATGFAGRTLKCKHTLPGNSSGTSQSPPVAISELRFNLPSTAAQSGPLRNARSPMTMTKQARRSSLQFRKHRSTDYSSRTPTRFDRSSSHSSDDRESPRDFDALDLSLGQENAGGGFGGKKAKLGKLIIEDEGLKMLDLVVAANMGVWWKVYQRVQGHSA